MSLLPLALSYLNRGYSVIPVGPNKAPLVAWKEFQGRKAMPEELVKWFTDFPDAQVGIVTGKISGITVIDVESDGDFSLVKDKTYTVESGSKGRHYYFKYEEGFKNAVRILPSVDVRSEGGYVVAPGSKTIKGLYTEIDKSAICQMSETTKKLLLGTEKTHEATGNIHFPKTTEGLEYSGAGEGNRNDSMTKFAGSIHAKIHPSLWETVGYKIFEDANKKNIPGLNQRELRTIWESIGAREKRQNPEGRIFREDFETEKKNHWGPDYNLTPKKNTESESDSKETLHISEVAKLQVIDTDHTYSTGMKPFDDALLGGFSAGEVIAIAGRSGVGKTSISQEWSVTLALGNKENKDSQLPVLWFSYEVLAKPLWQKFQLMGATEETPIYMPKFNESGEMIWIIDVIENAIEKWGIKVVAIDHLGFLRAPKGNYSNAADAITHTVRALKRLAVKHGLIIILPVHMRKTFSKSPDLDDIKESSGIAQESDSVFFIGREKDDDGQLMTDAKLWLVKNRKTGIAVSATFDYQFGRYFLRNDGFEEVQKLAQSAPPLLTLPLSQPERETPKLIQPENQVVFTSKKGNKYTAEELGEVTMEEVDIIESD